MSIYVCLNTKIFQVLNQIYHKERVRTEHGINDFNEDILT